MEKIDLEEMVKFFNQGRSAPVMPKKLLAQIKKGEHTTYRGLSTNLRATINLDPELYEISRKQIGFGDGCYLPLLELGEGKYIAFHPITGKRLGSKTKVYKRD